MATGLRWGGIWEEPDSVHIDDNLVGTDNVLWEQFYKDTQPNCQTIFDDEEPRTASPNDHDPTTEPTVTTASAGDKLKVIDGLMLLSVFRGLY